MKKVLEGSHAVAEAVRLSRVTVISAYPITPQTHIIEYLSDYVADGTLKASFLKVESEHSAIASLVGAASCGVRTFTSSSSQGLALMHEILHWTSGARLPIVMAEVNRALAPGWNIWADQLDSLSQRDTGWIQLYCEHGQEVLDTIFLAYRLAEAVSLPVMVIMDAFFLSHTYEPVDVPEQELVDRFLPAFKPKFQVDADNPVALSPLVTPNFYMEMRHNTAKAMEESILQLAEIEEDFSNIFGRYYGPVESFLCDDAEIIMVTSGTVTGTSRQVIQELREKGEKVGLLKIKLFRPFPSEIIRKALGPAKKIAIIDRNFSFGAGGIFAQEVRAAMCNLSDCPQIFGYIAGLGGRDVTTDLLEDIYWRTKKSEVPSEESIWMGLQEENHAVERS